PRLARAALSDEALFRALARIEDVYQLDEPPAYPHFELDRIAPPAQRALWRSASPAEGAGRFVRQLAGDVELRVKVYRRKMEASFRGLTDWLSASVTPAHTPVFVPARRSGKTGKGEVLSLPDREGNLSITLAVEAAGQGKAHLGVEVRDLNTDQPIERAQVSLRYARGAEVIHTQGGKATFVGLEPAEYTIEVKPARGAQAGRVWQLTITLE
ncbi:MAG TPA: hypothetical protein VIK33_05290, partial [Anaerolineae bacterium]